MSYAFDLTEGARRQAQVAVRCLGGAAVQLRLPAPPIAGDTGEELGLRSPQFQTLALCPVAVRRRSSGSVVSVVVHVPAQVLEDALGVHGVVDVRAALGPAASVQAADELFAVAGVEARSAGRGECMYRLLLQRHAWEVA